MTLLTDAELLARLVGFDSTSRNSNLPIADFICDYLDRPGIRIEKQYDSENGDADKVNLVVTIGPDADPETREGLMLSGHMDVVPAEEPDWESDPFTLTDKGDAWAGRGSCDMKGFVALAINTAARADAAKLKRPLSLVITRDEELGCLGARQLAEQWAGTWPRAAVIGEPTSLQPVRLHKGHATMRARFYGTGAHSGYPHLGESAIEPAAQAVCALADLRRELESERPEYGEHFGEVPFVALNIAQVHGGKAVNIVPDHCEILLGFRLLPGMTTAPIEKRVRAAIADAAGDARYDVELLRQSPPLLLEEDSPILREVCRLLADEGRNDESLAVSYATDGGWLQQGAGGTDCVIFGPGTIEVAHKPNESIPKDEFARAAGYLEKLVGVFCA